MPALVIGTFAPDFPYFLQLTPRGGYGHTITGAFTISLPLALAALWLYEEIVRDPIIALLPQKLKNRLRSDVKHHSFADASSIAWAILSALTGIITHILWDAFTHNSMWPYHHCSFLRMNVDIPSIGLIPIYKLLQYTSSILGITILACWFVWWYQKEVPKQHEEKSSMPKNKQQGLWIGVLFIASIGSGVRALLGATIQGRIHPAIFAGEMTVTFIALLWWELVLYGLFVKFRLDSRKDR